MWLSWAMDWPNFLATSLLDCDSYRLAQFLAANCAAIPRCLRPMTDGIAIYADATADTIAAVVPGSTPHSLVHHFPLQLLIAKAGLLAALLGLIWVAKAY